MRTKGRLASQQPKTRGELHWNSKLTEKDVLAIRSDHRSQYKIAAEHGIGRGQVHRIKARKQWAWL
jgi:DNA-binding CsgD family transcriptional regulator